MVAALRGVRERVHLVGRRRARLQEVVADEKLQLAPDGLPYHPEQLKLGFTRDGVEHNAVGTQCFPHLRFAHMIDAREHRDAHAQLRIPLLYDAQRGTATTP